MKRQLLILFALMALLVCAPMKSDAAGGGRGRGHGISSRQARGFGHGSGFAFGGEGYSDIYGYAELYRQLYNNLPYFALHPPVYYSYPVPRTYGYSPFAYPPHVMTPEVVAPVQPLQITNPHVPAPQAKPATPPQDSAAAVESQPQPLVIMNPFVGQGQAVAQAGSR